MPLMNIVVWHKPPPQNASSILLKQIIRFLNYYLREPLHIDLEKQLIINANNDFLGMLASLDCMHYRWKKIHVPWNKKNSII